VALAFEVEDHVLIALVVATARAPSVVLRVGMDFTEAPRVAEIVPKLRAFFASDILPLERELLARKSFKALLPELGAARDKVRSLGLWAPHLPVAWGGMGLSLTEHARVSEALGRSPLGHYTFNCAAPDIGNMEILHAARHGEQQERWLRPLAAGEIRSCFCDDRTGTRRLQPGVDEHDRASATATST
jgi:acyl-CoA dehydrogenase